MNDIPPPLAAALDAIRDHAHLERGDVDLFDIAKAEAMMLGYHYRWAGAMHAIRVLGVEVPFDSALVNPQTGAASKTFCFGGKIDVLIQSEDGVPGEIAGVLYDVLSKPTQRPLKRSAELKFNKDGSLRAGQRLEDETPEEYRRRIVEAIEPEPDSWYARVEVPRLEEDLAEAAADLWQTSDAIRMARSAGKFPRNPDACVMYGQECAYFSVCTRVTDIEDDLLYRTAERANEELPDDGKKRLPMLSTSAVRAFNACKRKYFYAYELKRRPRKTTNALALGTLVHHALEAWWKWWQVNDQRDLGGAIWVIEHKTTSEDVSDGSGYRKRLAIDPQVSNYHAAAHRLVADALKGAAE